MKTRSLCCIIIGSIINLDKSTPDRYTDEEKAILLNIARDTLRAITAGGTYSVDLESMPPALREPRACFVSLFRNADSSLRGCTGTLVARQALAAEVAHSTRQTAFRDPRFPRVKSNELDHLHIEISILTPSIPLTYTSAKDLVARLRPHQDGVTLSLGGNIGTFLPQVWDKIPEPSVFFLCHKMNLPCIFRQVHFMA